MIEGLLHPLLVPAHVAALVAVGLLIAPQRVSRAVAAFAVGLIGGLAAVALAYAPIYSGETLLVMSVAAGALTAWGRSPVALTFAVAAATGVALGLDSPPEVLSIREANWMLVGTAVGATIVVFIVAGVASRLTRPWQRIAARIIGSWIAASALLALALEIAR